ncbi:DUF502 domain-containing protein [Jiulongibacter sp. NS-SX5]|uniref:DUF502 domain-containing protein n=1 Tax=Jiulongibacter sp. NS-SX5 TaxID=3463854 RepID=UPI004059AF90
MERLLKAFVNYFVRGLLFVAPVGFTILILYSAFDFVDSIFRVSFASGTRNQEIVIPGLGFLLVIGITSLIGFVFSQLLPNTIQIWIENKIKNLPLVKIFYSAFKDLISAFIGDKKKFKTPVLVTLNKENNIRKLGFLTQESFDEIGEDDSVAVYCPHSYAFSGDMFILPKESVKPVNISAAEAMKLIVSGGVSMSESTVSNE